MPDKTRIEELHELKDPGSFGITVVNGRAQRIDGLAAALRQDGYAVKADRGPDLSGYLYTLQDIENQIKQSQRSEQDIPAFASVLAKLFDPLIDHFSDFVGNITNVQIPDMVFINYANRQQCRVAGLGVRYLLQVLPPDSMTQKPLVYSVTTTDPDAIVAFARINHAAMLLHHRHKEFEEELREHNGLEAAVEKYTGLLTGMTSLARLDTTPGKTVDMRTLHEQIVQHYREIPTYHRTGNTTSSLPEHLQELHFSSLMEELEFRLSGVYYALYREQISSTTSTAAPSQQQPRSERIVYGKNYPGTVVVMVIRQPTMNQPVYHAFIDMKSCFRPRQPPSSKHMFVLNDLSRSQLDDLLIRMSPEIAHVSEYNLIGEAAGNSHTTHDTARKMAAVGFRNYSYAERQHLRQADPGDRKRYAH